MEMQQLHYFVKAAELGGFTRAAEACFVSQPTLSQAIAKLEQELEQPLFERLGRRIQLTEAGRLLLERAQRILSLVDDARQAIANCDEEGKLIVGAIPTIAPYLVPAVLTSFAGAFPKARVILQEHVTASLLRKCLAAEIDLAVMALPVAEPRLEVLPLFEEELLLAMPKGHPLEKRRNVTLSDLEAYPMVLLNDGHCLSEQITAYCRRKHLQPVGTERVEQLATVQELVALGHGISLIPEMARRLDRDRRRVYRSLSGLKPKRTVCVVWRQGKHFSGLLGKFVNELKSFRFAER